MRWWMHSVRRQPNTLAAGGMNRPERGYLRKEKEKNMSPLSSNLVTVANAVVDRIKTLTRYDWWLPLLSLGLGPQ